MGGESIGSAAMAMATAVPRRGGELLERLKAPPRRLRRNRIEFRPELASLVTELPAEDGHWSAGF